MLLKSLDYKKQTALSQHKEDVCLMYKIIDSHCHIYPDAIAQKASDGTGHFYDIKMCHDGKVSTLLEQGKAANIGHYIVQSVATTPKQVSSINHYIANEVSKSGGMMTGLGTLHPESDDIKADFDELISLGLKGVKIHPDIQGFKLDDYRCLKFYELCEGKIPILIHTGDHRYDYSNTNRLIPLLEIFENLTIIGAHFGGWSVWEEATKQLKGYKNLYVDCSSSFYAMTKEKATALIKEYGADRVLFGTDYPMWNPGSELECFYSLGLSDEDNKKILHDNAVKVFNLHNV